MKNASETVRPEPVEGLSFSHGRRNREGFDKLSPNGLIIPAGLI